MMTESRGKKAWEIDERIKNNEKARRMLLAKNAELLDTIYEEKLYKELLGFEDGEWAGYLADLEIFYTRNQINTYRRLYRKLTLELDIAPEVWVDVPITRLSDCLPVLTKSNYGDWFTSALSLTSRDWNIELRKFKGLDTEEDEIHTHDNQIFEICRTCGKKHKLNVNPETFVKGNT